MDIRNFFSPVNKSKSNTTERPVKSDKKRKKHIVDSDEEDPLPSKVKKSEVSDDDIFIYEPTKSKAKKIPLTKKNSVPNKSLKAKAPKLKEVSANDFFGSSVVSQSKIPAVAKSSKRKKPADITKHNDDDDDEAFAQTLLELDNDYKPKKPKTEEPNCPNENSPPEKKSGLASKLALKKWEKDTKPLRSSPRKIPPSPLKVKKEVELKLNKTPSEKKPSRESFRTPKDNSKQMKQDTKTPEESKKLRKVDKVTPRKQLIKSNIEIVKNESPKMIPATPPPTPETEDKKRKAYMKYLSRAGPKNPGAKPLPEGKEHCLLGLTFVLTGVLDTIDRTETADLIKKFGGKVTTTVSKNTKYVVAGDDPGESKMKKAQQLGTKLLNEDELFALISSTKATSTTKVKTPTKTLSLTSSPEVSQTTPKRTTSGLKRESKNVSPRSISLSSQESAESLKKPSIVSKKSNSQESSSTSCTSSANLSPPSSQGSSIKSVSKGIETSMWVDKYKPSSLKAIIGQQGDQSNAKKLVRWLENWFSNHDGTKKLIKPSPWAKDTTGAFFKAALLSGPPGVGKTTTAHLVSKELGFDLVELNASDSRSKKTLEEHVLQLLTNQSLSNYATGNGKKSTSHRHVLIMDEVDGMAGNEDRGGVAELINLIKASRIPIICMCNDRNHQKIRSLANHCFDLRFYKPKVEQIRGAMLSVCFKEGIKIKADALDQMIIGSNQDVRQVLHHLSMWSADQKVLDSDDIKKEAKMAKKDMKIGPWDVVNKVFSESANKEMSIHDKIGLFFHDYSIGPLFVQENYLKVLPSDARGNPKKLLQQISKTASILADADLIDRAVRSQNAWSLLPTQALFSSVLPGTYMAGHFSSQIEFPKWLGNNSRRNKFDRLAQELHMHMRLRISGSKRDIVSGYGAQVKDAIINPLVKSGSDGVKDAVNAMTSHDLVREDLDSLIELSSWPGFKDPMSEVETKVKSAFTRTLNKDSHMNPFSSGSTVSKKKLSKATDDPYGDDEEDIEETEEQDEDISKNTMIKAVKKMEKKETTKSNKGGKKKSTKK